MIDKFNVQVHMNMNNFYCINLIEEDEQGQLRARIGHFEASHSHNNPWVAQTSTEVLEHATLGDHINQAEMRVTDQPSKANQLYLAILYEVDDLLDTIDRGYADLADANIDLAAQRIAFRSHLSAQAEDIDMPKHIREQQISAATPHAL